MPDALPPDSAGPVIPWSLTCRKSPDLECGAALPGYTLASNTCGELNGARNPVTGFGKPCAKHVLPELQRVMVDHGHHGMSAPGRSVPPAATASPAE
jgi:hypothetical protein